MAKCKHQWRHIYCVEYEGWGVVLILCCDKCGKIKKVRCL